MDDHAVFAEALAARLGAEPDLEVVGTASTSAQVLDLLTHDEIDVVTLDLSLGGQDGLALGRRLRDRWPALGIVVVTAAAGDDRVGQAVRMGVRGWVAKQDSIEALLLAVRGAAQGGTHLPAASVTPVPLSDLRAGRESTPEADAIAVLTARELYVLRCLMTGESRGEIGAMLHISANTVRTHTQRILRKLNVHSALTAVALARRAGVVGVRTDEKTPANDLPPVIGGRGSPGVSSS
jgi:DNA-binding NarL/FixJ family response regulator